MRVGMLIDCIVAGSAPKTIGQGVRRLRALGHECDSIVIKPGYPALYSYHMDGVVPRALLAEYPWPVRRFDFRFPGFAFFSLHHLTSGVLAPSVVREREWDVLVVHGSFSCFTARALQQARGIPYLPFIWDPASYILPKVYRKRTMGKFFPVLLPMARWTDHYVTESCLAVLTSGRLHHKRLRRFTQRPLEILYPGCFPLAEWPRWDQREDLMLTFDRWDIGNTPNQFLDMLARMRSRAKLVVAGHWYPESLKQSFLRAANARGLGDRVLIEGPLDEAKIQAWCARVKLHLHPNEEAFGMQCLEAAACGCPIIVPEGSGVTELFEHGVHGFFPRTDPSDEFRGDMALYAEHADELFSNPRRAEEMSRAAWQTAQQWSWDRHAEVLDGILRRHVKSA